MLTNSEYLNILLAEGDAFADSVQNALTAPVASCEPWVGADLLWHMVEVHYSWKFIVQSHLMDPEKYVPRDKPSDDDMLQEYRDGLHELIDVLSTTDASRSCWTWAGVRDVAWVIRRMAHETAVHAWDARCAAGVESQIPAALASDGIDEFVFVMLDNVREGERALSGSVHVHCTDVDGEWLIVPSSDGALQVTREHAKGACAIRGTAHELLMALWRRVPMSAIEVIGDTAVAQQFLSRAANN
jgi:uncharacterized protein (TIGR03083 family)